MFSFLKPAAAPAARPHRELVARGALLLDVRTPEEFATGHVAGALNIPVSDLGARLAEIGSKKIVVVYCRSGARSCAAATVLRDAGHEVHDLGSMGNW